MQLENIDWIIISAFFVISLLIGVIVSKKSGKDITEFFLSGRKMPWWLLGISMVATTFSADTPNLVTDIVRTNGVAGNWVWGAFLLTGMLTVFIYAKLWRRSKVLTDLEFYELRYSGKGAAFLRGFRAFYLGAIFNVLIMASVCLAGIKIGGALLGLSPVETLLISCGITVIYSSIGGLRGIIITDFFQFILAMLATFWAAYEIVSLPQIQGLTNLLNHPDVIPKLSLIPDIADTVYLAVSFMAGCSDISISQPSDAWVLNKSTEDDRTGASKVNNLDIKLNAYDWNYYSLEDIVLQYKKSNQPDNAYNAIESYIKVEEGDEIGDNDEKLPLGSVNLAWDMYDLEDGDYDIRAYTNCNVASVVSEVHSGHKDTRLPEPFGAAQPADGILSPNDEIQMNWSEAIDENRFYSAQTNITMSAIKNMSEVSHDAFVYMDYGSTLEIPYGLNLQNTSFTVEMWINPESPGILFEQGYDNNRLSMLINTDNTLRIQYENAGDIVTASSVTNLAMATDQIDAWQHVAFVFDKDLYKLIGLEPPVNTKLNL